MTTAAFIIALFYRIDNQMTGVAQPPQAALYPYIPVVTWRSSMCSKGAVNGRFIAGFGAIACLLPSAAESRPLIPFDGRPCRLDRRLPGGTDATRRDG